jgi:aldose 1-epimerase
VRWMPWALASRDAVSVTLRCITHPQPGYPWTLEIANTWSLDDEGLRVSTTIVNRSDAPAPVAAGFHPYVTVGTAFIDATVLTLPADIRLTTGPQQIPDGRESVAGTAYDFREPRVIGGDPLDYCYSSLHRDDDDGRCRVRMTNPADGRTLALWVNESYPYVEVFTGDTVGDPARRRRSLAIEPMSAPPNGLVTGEGIVTLAPGAHWNGQWGINPNEYGKGDGK